MAVQLAIQYFFGEATMASSTYTSLDQTKIKIKAIVLSKFGTKMTTADKELLWSKCKIAIGQKCKFLRTAKRAAKAPKFEGQ